MAWVAAMVRASLSIIRTAGVPAPRPASLSWTETIASPVISCDEVKALATGSGTGEGWLTANHGSNAPAHDSLEDDAMALSLTSIFSSFASSNLCFLTHLFV